MFKYFIQMKKCVFNRIVYKNLWEFVIEYESMGVKFISASHLVSSSIFEDLIDFAYPKLLLKFDVFGSQCYYTIDSEGEIKYVGTSEEL